MARCMASCYENRVPRIQNGVSGARYSKGYGDIRHLPTLPVENHALKP
jgi:hypothetical protein